MSYLLVFTVLNSGSSRVYVTRPYIHFYCLFLKKNTKKTEANLWTDREAICESQLVEADQASHYCLRAALWSPTVPILVLCVPKANMFAPFFLSDSQVE